MIRRVFTQFYAGGIGFTLLLVQLPLPSHQQVVVREAYLMGTRSVLTTKATDREAGLDRLERVLRILEESEEQLSTWRPESALSRLNRTPAGVAFPLPADLCRLFSDLQFWVGQTAGAFDPAVGELVRAWDLHGQGRVPTAEEIQLALRSSGLGRYEFSIERCQIKARGPVRIDAGAFGKGEALDRASLWLGGDPKPVLIDLGGQVAVIGSAPANGWTIGLAGPTERDIARLELRLTSGSLATSGGSERDLQVAGNRVGHILDPRTGYPAPFTGSVSVWHESALVADILSTALYVMGPEEGISWAEARGIAACYWLSQTSEPDQPALLPTSRFRNKFTLPDNLVSGGNSG